MVMWCHVICPYFLCLVSSWRGPEILPGICTDALPIFQPTASGMQRLLFPWNTTATRVYNSPMEQYSTAIRSVRSYMSDKIFRPPWSNNMTLLVFTIDFMCKREVSININNRWFHNPTSTFNITCATQPPCFKIQVWDFHNRPVSTHNTTEYNRHFKGQQKSFSKYSADLLRFTTRCLMVAGPTCGPFFLVFPKPTGVIQIWTKGHMNRTVRFVLFVALIQWFQVSHGSHGSKHPVLYSWGSTNGEVSIDSWRFVSWIYWRYVEIHYPRAGFNCWPTYHYFSHRSQHFWFGSSATTSRDLLQSALRIIPFPTIQFLFPAPPPPS